MTWRRPPDAVPRHRTPHAGLPQDPHRQVPSKVTRVRTWCGCPLGKTVQRTVSNCVHRPAFKKKKCSVVSGTRPPPEQASADTAPTWIDRIPSLFSGRQGGSARHPCRAAPTDPSLDAPEETFFDQLPPHKAGGLSHPMAQAQSSSSTRLPRGSFHLPPIVLIT